MGGCPRGGENLIGMEGAGRGIAVDSSRCFPGKKKRPVSLTNRKNLNRLVGRPLHARECLPGKRRKKELPGLGKGRGQGKSKGEEVVPSRSRSEQKNVNGGGAPCKRAVKTKSPYAGSWKKKKTKGSQGARMRPSPKTSNALNFILPHFLGSSDVRERTRRRLY